MSQKHKIAESIDELARLVNCATQDCDFSTSHAKSRLVQRANPAISYLVHLFLCEKCQGSGDTVKYAVRQATRGSSLNERPEMVECSVCGGTGIKPDILNRLEAEEITQGSGDGNRQG